MILPSLFNPSNDMALAADLCQYTPPRHIRQMEEDLAELARFWEGGPWGWSLATKRHYRQMGIAESLLPSDEWLAEHRRLSSREFGVEYYRTLSNLSLEGRGNSISQQSVIDAKSVLVPCRATFVTSYSVPLLLREGLGEGLILKSPWSSSGRGNILVRDNLDETAIRRIEKIISEQGGIVVEPFYADKELDFALEFMIANEGVRFLGYSVFFADEMGHYGGNCVESQDELLRRIALPEALLQHLIDYHLSQLSRLSYRGPVGIDMMRLSDGRVHPCVEINFRRTMGLLALALYNKGITGNQLLAGNPRQGFSAQIVDGRLTIVCHS